MSNYRTILNTMNSITPEYQAYLDRLTFLGFSHPDEATKIKHNNAVKSLVDNGLWSKIRSLKFFWNSNINAIRVDVRNPSLFQGTFNGVYTFTANQGVLFNKAGLGYFHTGFIPSSSGGSLFTSSNAGAFIYIRTVPTSNTAIYGNGVWYFYHIGSDTSIRLNSYSNIATSINLSGIGVKAVYRDNTTLNIYNNAAKSIQTKSSDGLNPNPVFIANHAGTYTQVEVGGIQVLSAFLTETEHNLLVSINNTLIS
ncbi:hypothetical protein [Flavobacterium koreense]